MKRFEDFHVIHTFVHLARGIWHVRWPDQHSQSCARSSRDLHVLGESISSHNTIFFLRGSIRNSFLSILCEYEPMCIFFCWPICEKRVFREGRKYSIPNLNWETKSCFLKGETIQIRWQTIPDNLEMQLASWNSITRTFPGAETISIRAIWFPGTGMTCGRTIQSPKRLCRL